MAKAIPRIQAMAPYVPGRSIAEIKEKYNLPQVVKLASNENPLGASPLVQEAIRKCAADVFRYPQGGNPALTRAIAERFSFSPEMVVVGNGSDEIIDMLMRICAQASQDNIVCCDPCFGMYAAQAEVNGLALKKVPLKQDFSFDFDGLLKAMDGQTRLVFLTTPDNPSGYCPGKADVLEFVGQLQKVAPDALVVLDEAYMDFADNEEERSLLASGNLPANVAVLRTFSKSMGLAGIRLGFAILQADLAQCYWRARLPFSVNVLAEAAGLAALEDGAFYKASLRAVREGRRKLREGLAELGCHVWPSESNFLMFRLPENSLSAGACFDRLLARGIIIRPLASYGLPENLRVSVGNERENRIFLRALAEVLNGARHAA